MRGAASRRAGSVGDSCRVYGATSVGGTQRPTTCLMDHVPHIMEVQHGYGAPPLSSGDRTPCHVLVGGPPLLSCPDHLGGLPVVLAAAQVCVVSVWGSMTSCSPVAVLGGKVLAERSPCASRVGCYPFLQSVRGGSPLVSLHGASQGVTVALLGRSPPPWRWRGGSGMLSALALVERKTRGWGLRGRHEESIGGWRQAASTWAGGSVGVCRGGGGRRVFGKTE